METIKLNNGLEMPILGFGVYQIPDAGECERSVTDALAVGYRSIDTHPFHQQIETQEFLHENDVQIESWGPFAEGRNNLFTNKLLTSVAKKYNKSVAQVTLRWLTQRGVVVIPKTVHKQRMIENFSIFDFELSADDRESIATLDTKTSSFFDHRDPVMTKRLSSFILPE